MAETPARQSALAGLCPESPPAAADRAPAIAMSEQRGLTLIDLRGDRARAPFLADAAKALKVALPLAPNTSVGTGDGAVMCLGPDQWLLSGAGFHEALPITGGFLTDVSHGRAALRISGTRSRELLAKGCSVDLHPARMPPGSCAQTSIARVGVLLHMLDAGGDIDLYCARSYAGELWHWVAEAAAEYGYRV